MSINDVRPCQHEFKKSKNVEYNETDGEYFHILQCIHCGMEIEKYADCSELETVEVKEAEIEVLGFDANEKNN